MFVKADLGAKTAPFHNGTRVKLTIYPLLSAEATQVKKVLYLF